jgi:glycosyltransferase involved in cell wall biosynthesis
MYPPRVLAYTDNTGIGGAEVTLATLVRTLGDAIEPTLMGTDRRVLGWVAARCPGVPAVLVPRVRDKRDLRPIAAHVRAVRARRPDILHANLHHSWSSQYALLAAMLTPGVRTVAVEHSLWPPSTPLQRRLRTQLVGRLDAHVAVGERLARAVEQVIGRPPGSVDAIHNGVPDVRLAPLPRLRPEPTLGFVGRLADEKGPDLLLEAAARLPGCAVVLVGDGPDRARLERLATKLGLEDRTVFTGWSDDVRRLLPTFDIVVQPSRREGFGLTLVEAMLAERPVVAADVGGVREVVVDGDTGLLVPPEDAAAVAAAAARLLADPEERRTMGAKGRARALERFTADAMARRFAAVYARVLG